MPASVTLHTTRTLHDKWNERYEDASERIKELKAKMKKEKDPDEQMAIHGEMQELLIQANLIHQFIQDTGVMVFVEERTDGGTPP